MSRCVGYDVIFMFPSVLSFYYATSFISLAVRLWSLQTYTTLVSFKGHVFPVWGVDFRFHMLPVTSIIPFPLLFTVL